MDTIDQATVSKVMQAMQARRRRAPRTCAVCGANIAGTTRRQYCGNTCAARAYRARQRDQARNAAAMPQAPAGAPSATPRARPNLEAVYGQFARGCSAVLDAVQHLHHTGAPLDPDAQRFVRRATEAARSALDALECL